MLYQNQKLSADISRQPHHPQKDTGWIWAVKSDSSYSDNHKVSCLVYTTALKHISLHGSHSQNAFNLPRCISIVKYKPIQKKIFCFFANFFTTARARLFKF